MNKITAMNALLNGECDGIKHGTSTFIVEKDSIINKRSKKLLDTKHLSEEDWEGIVDPKWYDELEDSNGILCWVSNEDVSIVRSRNEKGMFINAFDDVLGDDEQVWPVEVSELEEFLINGIPHAKKTRKKVKEEPTEGLSTVEVEEPTEKAEEFTEEVDDGVEIHEGNDQDSQNESLENTVSPKEDAGDDENQDNEEIDEEEIPF